MILRSDATQEVDVPGHGTMRMHLFRPAIEVRAPAVLLFSEFYQVTALIRKARRTFIVRDNMTGTPARGPAECGPECILDPWLKS